MPEAIDLPREAEIHVWHLTQNQHLIDQQVLQGLLGEEELSRASRFLQDRDRLRFIFRRGWLRILLSRYLEVSPGELKFVTGPYGKLSLIDRPKDLRFNLSHSHGQALFAFTCAREVGIDLEVGPVQQLNLEGDQERSPAEVPRHYGSYLGVAERFFAPEEVKQLSELSDDMWMTGFLNCWTRKEAYLKALGLGLSKSLQEFAVTLKPGEAARLLHDASDPQAPNRWGMHALDLPGGVVGAVVTEGREAEVTVNGSFNR